MHVPVGHIVNIYSLDEAPDISSPDNEICSAYFVYQGSCLGYRDLEEAFDSIRTLLLSGAICKRPERTDRSPSPQVIEYWKKHL